MAEETRPINSTALLTVDRVEPSIGSMSETMKDGGYGFSSMSDDELMQAAFYAMVELDQRDHELYLRVVREVTAASQERDFSALGDKHPLASLLKTRPSRESVASLAEGMREYRESVEKLDI